MIKFSQILKKPLRVQLHLTYNCNLRCIHCCFYRLGNKKNELSSIEVKSVISQLSKLGTILITLSGGEIFLRKDIFDLLGHASELGIKIIIYSNLTLCSKKILERLKRLSIYRVETSIYGSNSLSHDRVTQVDGSFGKTMRCIKMLRDNGIEVIIKCPLIKETVKEIERIIEMSERMGIEFSLGDYIIAEKAFSETCGIVNPKFYRVNIESLEKAYLHPYILKKINIEDLKQRDFILRRQNLEKPICEAGHYRCHIRPDGGVFPCNLWLIKLGNVRETSIEKIWNASESLKKIRNIKLKCFKGCLECSFIKYCDLCPAIIYDFHHNRWRENLNFCKKAKLLHRLALGIN